MLPKCMLMAPLSFNKCLMSESGPTSDVFTFISIVSKEGCLVKNTDTSMTLLVQHNQGREECSTQS